MIGFLTGKTPIWATAIWENGGEPTTNYDDFVTLFHSSSTPSRVTGVWWNTCWILVV